MFRYSPRQFHLWRSFLLRLFGASIGEKVHVYPRVKVWAPWNIRLGDECGIGNGAILYSQGTITIGRRAVISQGAHLCAGTHDYNLPGFPADYETDCDWRVCVGRRLRRLCILALQLRMVVLSVRGQL